jgi:hypothetical protein
LKKIWEDKKTGGLKMRDNKLFMEPIDLLEVITIPKSRLKRILKNSCDKAGSESWLFTGGFDTEGRVCLVAHIDTVFDDDCLWYTDSRSRRTSKGLSPRLVYKDKEQGIIWSPSGLGADDRAGVYGVMKLFSMMKGKYQPVVLLTDHEESGCFGAYEAREEFADELEKCLFLVELDRRGTADAVFYNFEPREFVSYIQGYGFLKTFGSVSDISVISRGIALCGVNLSIGYMKEHTEAEFLNVNILESTISKVEKLIVDSVDIGRRWKLDYVPDDNTITVYDWKNDYDYDDWKKEQDHHGWVMQNDRNLDEFSHPTDRRQGETLKKIVGRILPSIGVDSIAYCMICDGELKLGEDCTCRHKEEIHLYECVACGRNIPEGVRCGCGSMIKSKTL